VRHDKNENPVVTGFCIDVFNAVIEKLGYSADSYHFIPFAKPDGSPAGSYDDLVQQVSNKVQYFLSFSYLNTMWKD